MEIASHARHMRNNPTEAEQRLWQALSARKVGGARFNRQVRIAPFICDFVARRPKLIVEVDGGQHAENEADERRTRFLESKGYRVLRFWNNDVLGNLDGVVREIERALATLPSPSPSRKREGSDGAARAKPALPFREAGGVGGGADPSETP